MTVEAFEHARGIRGIFEALYEHPAVSSVGWDVVLCGVSWCMWAVTEGCEIGAFKTKRDAEIK